MTTLATCWSMTLNNPDENEMVLVRNPNPEYIRQIIWTAEVGEEGTPHVQAFVKLMKQQRLSFIKKLYPRGHFKSITADEYKHNCSHYAQKDDDTTIGSHVITYNEQIPDVVQFLRSIVEESMGVNLMREEMPIDKEHWLEAYYYEGEMLDDMRRAEKKAVIKRPSVAKLLVSPTYTRIKKLYLREITENILDAFYYKQNADDNTGQGTGETSDDESVATGSTSEEEEEQQEGDEDYADQGADCGSEQDCEQEGGD